ncbi:CaiB/BaiF CoA-transferase family protein [Lentibacillus sp. CBA3610]|uniref:CaiB/BaiF CoA transferase family protein n=1 Tax=Lentibacillus sp. CBA3610 TaxID=2518176 RepID=UPI001595350B|nr:CaiB/BaiF CoA-transferase family protein [Lentibacillus sp. CBA3610]QKY70162.1 CoA transferase [Lentibacillus sp. CBA3610]
MLPLEGIKVVSLEQAVAAPFASRQLADMGARVIKIERPGDGDFARYYDQTVNGMSSHFVWLNRSKESLSLNMKADDGKSIFTDLIKDADVLIQNLAPGAINRLGFSDEELHNINESLIICHISGYGSNGSYVSKKAYDLLIQCEAGFLSITGHDDAPAKAGISVADIAAGMYAYSGILSSLIKRSKTGQGDILDISMLEALGEWMGYPMYYSLYGGYEPKRTGAQHATIYPYGPFPVKNGKTVFFAIQNEREWARFCRDVLNKPDLANDERFNSNSRRVDNKAYLKNIIENVLGKMPLQDVMQNLEDNKIANAQLKNMNQFANHPQLKDRDRWIDVDTSAGRIQSLLPPAIANKGDMQIGPIPDVGQHTQKILNELGLSEDTIGKLKSNHTI